MEGLNPCPKGYNHYTRDLLYDQLSEKKICPPSKPIQFSNYELRQQLGLRAGRRRTILFRCFFLGTSAGVRNKTRYPSRSTLKLKLCHITIKLEFVTDAIPYILKVPSGTTSTKDINNNCSCNLLVQLVGPTYEPSRMYLKVEMASR